MNDNPAPTSVELSNKPNPAAATLSLISLLDGAMERGLVTGRDEAITCALIAALTFAIDSHARGAEAKALRRTQALFQAVVADFNKGVGKNTIHGGRHGGYDRR